MFFYIVLTQYLPLPVYEVPAIRVNTTKSTYTFTSVSMESGNADCSVVPRSRFLGDTTVPLHEFQRDICKFWGTHQIYQNFTCRALDKLYFQKSTVLVHFLRKE